MKHITCSNIEMMTYNLYDDVSTDDSTDEPIATDRQRKKSKQGAKRRKRSVSTESS